MKKIASRKESKTRSQNNRKKLTKSGIAGRAGTSSDLRARIVQMIRSLPKGTVSTYGAVAEAAGWPGAARQVVRILRQVPGLPWQRVVGSGGAIKLPGENGAEQRFRLQMEGVAFRGARIDMKKHEFRFGRARRGKPRKSSG
jgi:methylated-DNA-protein-cysteine methyltransferase related protein